MPNYDEIIAGMQDRQAATGMAPTNKYDTAVQMLGAQQDQAGAQAALNVAFSADQKPDDAAFNLQLAKRFNTTPEVVAAYPQEFRDRQRLELAREAMRDAPVLQRTLAALPQQATLVQDDLPNAAAVENTLKPSRALDYIVSRGEGRTLMGDIGNVGAETVKGLGGSFNRAGGSVNLLLGAFPAAYDAMMGTRYADSWFDTRVKPLIERQEVFQPAPDAPFLGKAANMGGSLVGMLSQIYLSGATAAQPALGPAIAPGAQTVGQVVTQATEHGIKAMAFPALSDAVNVGREVYMATGDSATAARAAQMQYLTATGQGIIPLSAPGGLLTRTAGGFASGVATGEAARQAMNQTLPANMAQPWDAEQAILQGLAGAVLAAGGPRGEGGYAAAIRETYRQTAQAEAAADAYGRMAQLTELATTSKWRERDPEGFREFVRTVAEDGQLADVYVEARAFAQGLERAGLRPEQLAETMPEVVQQLREAQLTEGFVRISAADYASRIAGTPLDQAILPELRVDPLGMSFREAQAFYQEATARMDTQAKELAAAREESTALRDSQQRVQEMLEGHLNTVGRFSPDVNRVYASIQAAMLARLAAREGITPEAAAAKYAPRIVAGGVEGGFDQGAEPMLRTVEVAGTRRPIENSQGQLIAPDFAKQTAFWSWFGNSKALNAGGKPVPVYHGTNADVAAFDAAQAGRATGAANARLGFFFTDRADVAGNYARAAGGDGQNIVPAYLRLENPLELRAANMLEADKLLMERLKPENDGAVVRVGEGDKAQTVYMVRDPEQAKSVFNRGTFNPADPNILNQGARGMYVPEARTIALLKDADLSTYLHETGHWALDTYARVAAGADAPLEVQADMAAVLKWFGVDSLERWNTMSLEEQRPFHEKFARGFEAYLMEGKAPSRELVPFFQRVRSWMVNIYRTLRGLDVELSPEVRQVFDRMLASDEAIREAQAMRAFEPVVTEKPAGVSAEEWARYQELGAEATNEAVELMQSRSLRDMKWLSGAKSRAVKELQKQAKAARDAVTREVEEEVGNMPEYQLQDFLKGKKLKDLDAEQLADDYGYRSVAEMERALAEAPPRKEVIAGLVDRYMLERHGELASPEAIESAASAAIHNDARARFMATGLKMLTSSPIPASQLVRGARDAARSAVAEQRVRDLSVRQYEAAETRSNREAIKLAAKDPRGAAQAQRAALLNNQLVKATHDALEDVRKSLEYFKRLERKPAQDGMRGEYLDQLNELLARFDLRTSASAKDRKPLAEWVTAEAERLSAVMPDLPEWVLNDGFRVSYKDMTVNQVRGLRDAIRQLEHMARREQKQYMAIRAMEFADERGAVLGEIRKHWSKAFDAEGNPKGVEPDFVPSIRKAVGKLGDKFAGEFLNAETILSILGGGKFSVVNESLFGRLSARSDWKAERLSGIYKDLKPLFDQYSLKEKFDFGRADIATPAGLDTPLTRENALVVALLHGNAEGRERLANYGWSEAKQRQIIDLLDARDIKLANAIWKLFDGSLWPELKALNDNTRGKSPPKVEAVSYAAKGGEATGGYFRLKYDTALDERAHRLDEGQAVKELLGGGMGMSAKTNQGSSTERKQDVKLRPRLDLGVFAEAVNETVHDLAYREAVADTMRMLDDAAIRNAIKQVVGTEGYRALVNRVREVAAPPRNPSGFVESAISVARRNTVVNLMSGVKTALQNFTGLAPAMAEVNPGTLAAEVARFYSPAMMERYNFAMEQSAFMRNRFTHYERDLQSSIKKLTVNGSLRPDESTFLALMGFVDKGVSVPVWNAAFKQGMERFANDTAKAVDYADHVVRQTQGSGRDVDLAKIMSGHGPNGEFKRAFTMFYSYFNSQLNLLVKHGVQTRLQARESVPEAAAKAAAKLVAIVVVPTLLTEMLMNGWQKDGESEEEQQRRFAGAFVKYGAGFFPLVRDIVPGVWAAATGERSYGAKVSPIGSAYEGAGRAVKAAIDVSTGDNDERDTKDLIMGVGYLAGVPGKLVSDTVEGTRQFIAGEAGPEAILLGPPKK